MAETATQSEAVENVHQVEFLFIGELNDVMFNPHLPDGLTVHLGDPDVRIILSGVSFPIKYRALVIIKCNSEQYNFVRSLIDGRYIPISGAPLMLPHFAYGKEKITAEGSIAEGYGLRQHHLPPSICALCAEARVYLGNQVSRLVRIFRWAQNIDAPHNSFDAETGALYWKVDPTQKEFRGVPLRSNAQSGRSPIGIGWSEDDQRLLKTLLLSDAQEPLAHELRREGIALSATAPRSAVLALSSALEIGVKQHVARVAPDTAWLMEELPSPPIHKILKNYLSILHSDRTDIKWNCLQKMCKHAQELSEIRNKLAHSGKIAIRIDLNKYIILVTDWLYFLDFLYGHSWAADHISAATRASLGWPPSSSAIYHFTIGLEE